MGQTCARSLVITAWGCTHHPGLPEGGAPPPHSHSPRPSQTLSLPTPTYPQTSTLPIGAALTDPLTSHSPPTQIPDLPLAVALTDHLTSHSPPPLSPDLRLLGRFAFWGIAACGGFDFCQLEREFCGGPGCCPPCSISFGMLFLYSFFNGEL